MARRRRAHTPRIDEQRRQRGRIGAENDRVIHSRALSFLKQYPLASGIYFGGTMLVHTSTPRVATVLHGNARDRSMNQQYYITQFDYSANSSIRLDTL
jgi:hypothetical protein